MKPCRYQATLDSLRAKNRLRSLCDMRFDHADIVRNGRRMVNLSSNDYMGIAADGTLWQDFLEQEQARGDFGGGSCSSRLLTGNHPDAVALENTLAAMYDAPALLFNSGYHANLGILPAVSSRGDLILADKLVHASLIDGIRLAPAQCIRFPHNDMERLEEILEKRRADFDRVFIVTESIFSMDGDLADLLRLAAIKSQYDAMLYVDEAHAVGVRGVHGLGLAEELGVLAQIDFLVGTFGKAYASQGAFIITSAMLREYLINTMRPLIFSTALPPISLRWTLAVCQYLAAQKERRNYLQKLANTLRQALSEAGLEVGGASQVVPLMIRDNDRAVHFSQFFGNNGFFVPPIRPPSVPIGSERLRISLHAALTPQQIDIFSALCKQFGH